MFPLDHYEWRLPRLHYGPPGTLEFARRRYRDVTGEWALPMFPDLAEPYREYPFEYPVEQMVKRKHVMHHFQRMAMEERILQGHATFQLAPEGIVPKKRGRPSKAPSAGWEPPRAFTGECQCKTLFEDTQGDRSVVNYTEDFIAQAKQCKPKSAEMWCGWYKHGLRGDIKRQLKGVLEPLEFALVRRMAGFAIEAEERIAAEAEAQASAEGGHPGTDPRAAAGGQGESTGEPSRKKRGRPRKPSGESCDCGVLVQMVQKPRKVKDYLREFLETARMCRPKPAEEWCRLFKAGLREDIRDALADVLEPLEFALVIRIAGQALDAEEQLAQVRRATEIDPTIEDDEDAGNAAKDPGTVDWAQGDGRDVAGTGGWLSD